MKTSEIKAEIKKLTAEQLQERISNEQSGLQRLQFAHAVTPLDNTMQLRQAKRLIARLKTELVQKQTTK